MKAFNIITILLIVPMLAQAEEASQIVIVPHSNYVKTDIPPCGVPNNLGQIADNPQLATAIMKALGPEAGGIVLGICQADKLAAGTGGDIAGLWRKASGQTDVSSCAITCVRLPKNVTPTQVLLSNRHGKTAKKYKLKNGPIVANVHNKDWSGWRDVVSSKQEGQWMVCGTALNWKHDQAATKRLAVEYKKTQNVGLTVK
jgi:hypothetical protein